MGSGRSRQAPMMPYQGAMGPMSMPPMGSMPMPPMSTMQMPHMSPLPMVPITPPQMMPQMIPQMPAQSQLTMQYPVDWSHFQWPQPQLQIPPQLIPQPAPLPPTQPMYIPTAAPLMEQFPTMSQPSSLGYPSSNISAGSWPTQAYWPQTQPKPNRVKVVNYPPMPRHV